MPDLHQIDKDLTELKQKVAQLQKTVADLKQQHQQSAPPPAPGSPQQEQG